MDFAKRKKSIVDILFILALFGAFAVTALFVVLFGARIYKRTVSEMDASFASRTALSYITEKVRSHDYTGGAAVDDIDIASMNGNSVLILNETVRGTDYVTYLYVTDGYLMEFTADASYDFQYDEGNKILEISGFEVKRISDSLYYFDVTDGDGNDTNFYVSLYSGTDGDTGKEGQ